MDEGEIKRKHQGIAVTQVVPMTGVRKKIAEHMTQSRLTSPQVTVFHELDVTEFVSLRSMLNQNSGKTGGVKISYTHLLVKALSQALKKHPMVNSTLVENEILLLEDINIGMALAMPDGTLIVPVIHQADRKSILEIARRAIELEQKGKTGKLTVSDMQKGTFTLSNVGMFPESQWFTPIINQGQCAILGTGAIRQIPGVREGQIVIRSVISTSITYDHRIIYGASILAFMQDFAQLLKNPFQIELGL